MIRVRFLEADDVQWVRRFLLTGFGAPADADFAAEDVLRWKYLEQGTRSNPPRGVLAMDGEQVVGFIGVDTTWFVSGGDRGWVTCGHQMDWLASEEHVAVGLVVLARANTCADVQLVIGGTPQSVAIRRKLGWQFRVEVPTFSKSLRPMHRLRNGRQDPTWKAIVKIGRDYGRRVIRPARAPTVDLRLRQVHEFGDEVERVSQACRLGEIYTARTAERLNHYLRFPRGSVTGWLLEGAETVRGLALLNVTPRGGARIGRIVDCFMDDPAPELWHSALHALTGQLILQKADVSLCYGSTDWMTEALSRSGYHVQKQSPLSIRDDRGLLPSDARFFLTLLEADHGYL